MPSKHLACWARPRRVRNALVLFPASSWLHAEPYGACSSSRLDYPFQLAIAPLAAALAAGKLRGGEALGSGAAHLRALSLK